MGTYLPPRLTDSAIVIVAVPTMCPRPGSPQHVEEWPKTKSREGIGFHGISSQAWAEI